ncbi:saccharopine dehydrogenase NADP-binding domain-containing protein [Agarilytica rhodophyticola]|uniref:saccharopine dehydrogenase NADP-binding domain-containing protein n=1 Tax=Agarilytica rhodophyticola TaxID=1737490 RepID=UPI002481F0AE|nr:saccharopine dehydrogenase NADP-binding domain-containing protein [Agarilytica rhodophyticola]
MFKAEDSAKYLDDIDVLINLAGPFALTQKPLIEACLDTHTHYMDVAGEYKDAYRAYEYHSQAQKQGIALIPAVGIFSAPMDIVSHLAASEIDNATSLKIGFASEGKLSRGSMNTAISKIQTPGLQLVNGKYEEAQPAQTECEMDIFNNTIPMATHPWRADLLLAKISTGVQNIETYSSFPAFMIKMMKGKLRWLKTLMERYLIPILPEGPSEKQQQQGKIYAKAIATNSKGEKSIAELIGPDAYLFTVASITELLSSLVASKSLSGFLAPSQLGTDWILKIQGISLKLNDKKFKASANIISGVASNDA